MFKLQRTGVCGGRFLNASCPSVWLFYMSEIKKSQISPLPLKASHMFPFNPGFQQPSDTETSPRPSPAQTHAWTQHTLAIEEGLGRWDAADVNITN